MTYEWPVSIGNHIWQSTVFAGAVIIAAMALQKNAARVRHALWVCASVKFLAPFSMLVAIGGFFELPTAATMKSAMAARMPVMVDSVFSPVARGSAAPLSSIPNPHMNWTPYVLMGLWGFGFAVVLIRWMREWMRVRKMVQASKPLAIECGVRVRSTKEMIEPGVFGIFRPVLLLPEGIADRLTSSEFASVIAHEMCHVRRRDNLWAAIHGLVESIFWFHPLVWWIGTRLIEERERACDEEVVRVVGEPESYAEGILKVCEFYLESPGVCVAGVTGADLKRRIREIVSGRVSRRVGLVKKTALAIAGIAAIAGPIAIGVVDAPRLHAQSAGQGNSGKRLAFEVASVKPSNSDDRRWGFDFPPGGKAVLTNVPLAEIIKIAYNLPIQNGGDRLKGGPAWISQNRYDIEAVAPKAAFANDKTIGERENKLRQMLQTLLADRFKLVIRSEMRELPVYAVVVGKGGPKFERSQLNEKDCLEKDNADTACHNFNGGMGRGLHAAAANMDDLATFVENWTDRPVVDKTGLSGLYKIETMGWRPIEPPQDRSGKEEGGVAWEDRPTIFEIFEKLGLKLESQKAPIEMYIIESAEKPTEN